MITILCSGSRGDIQPYLALAVELKKMNREVRLVSGKSFKDLADKAGIDYIAMDADLNSVEIDPKLLEAAGNSTNPLKMLLTFNKMKKYARYMVDEMADACVGSDIIVYHPGCTIGYFMAEYLGIPSVLATPFPMHKTKERRSVIAYGKTKIPTTLSYDLLQKMLWTASKPGIVSLWKERFHRLPLNFGCPFEKVDANHPSVVSCSNFVFPRPNDWNENIHQFGYWFLDALQEQPNQELVEFLKKGEQPIYFGFGSVFNPKDKDHFLNTIISTVNKLGKRAILCGMGEIEGLPEHIFAIKQVDHRWLFPRCLAVCHHGGAGTAATGFAAGKPSIIVPFSNDQFAWGHVAYDLGVASKPIYKNQFNESNLIAAIQYISRENVMMRANQLGENISSENGAKDCAKIISKLIK